VPQCLALASGNAGVGGALRSRMERSGITTATLTESKDTLKPSVYPTYLRL